MRNTKKMAEILAEMIDARGSRRAFAEKIGIPPTTLQSMLTRDLSRASVTNVIDVCKELGITIEELENMTTSSDTGPYYALTAKDERDIAIMLENMMEGLQDGQSMNFMGEPMDENDRELLRISLENTIRMSKQMAKKKFTPKKYRDGE